MLWHKAIGAGGTGGSTFFNTLVIQDVAVNAADRNNYEFINQSFGSNYTGRSLLVVCTALGRRFTSVNSITADNKNSASLLQYNYDDGRFGNMMAMAIFNPGVVTSSSGTVDVNFNERIYGAAIGIYSFTGTATTSGSAVQTGSTGSGTFSNQTLVVPSGGFGIWLAQARNGTNWTITGDATKDYGLDANTNEWGASASIRDSGSTSTTLSSNIGDGAGIFGQAFSVS